MKPKKVFLFDTTLRDGAQAEGVSFSLADKIKITHLLDDIGIHVIEGGWPGANPKDTEFFKIMQGRKLRKAILQAFGSTRKASNVAEKDANLNALIDARTQRVNIFCKSWDFHVTEILGVSLEQNLEMIYDSIQYLKKHVPRVSLGMEHAFDGFKNNPAYVYKILEAAIQAGADAVGLADTNGGCMPDEIGRIFGELHDKYEILRGIHIHQDTGLAIAGTIKAIENGATAIAGTINGIGERCGMVDFCALIPNLKLKLGIDCVPDEAMKRLKEVSNFVAEACGMDVPEWSPYVGENAFYHKGGVHVQAVTKNPRAYNHVDPDLVGNKTVISVSELAGKANIIHVASQIGIDVDKNDPRVAKLLSYIKERESFGYHYENAETSKYVLFKQMLEDAEKKIKIDGFSTAMTKGDGLGDVFGDDSLSSTEATVFIRIDGKKERVVVSDSKGPLMALAKAVFIGVKKAYPELGRLVAKDIRLRVLEKTKEGKIGKLRIFLQTICEKTGEKLSTIGVANDISTAFLSALLDAIEYRLMITESRPDASEKVKTAAA